MISLNVLRIRNVSYETGVICKCQTQITINGHENKILSSFITAGHNLFKSLKVILFCPENKADLFAQNVLLVKLAKTREVNYFCG